MMELRDCLKKLCLYLAWNVSLYHLVSLKIRDMFKGEKGVLKVLRGSMIVMKCVRKNDPYVCLVLSESSSTTKKTVLSKIEIWSYDIEDWFGLCKRERLNWVEVGLIWKWMLIDLRFNWVEILWTRYPRKKLQNSC